MDLDKRYKDSNGIDRNILQMVKLEPEWAANIIQHYEEKLSSHPLPKSLTPETEQKLRELLEKNSLDIEIDDFAKVKTISVDNVINAMSQIQSILGEQGKKDILDSFVEHSHPQYGQGYFCTPDVFNRIESIPSQSLVKEIEKFATALKEMIEDDKKKLIETYGNNHMITKVYGRCNMFIDELLTFAGKSEVGK